MALLDDVLAANAAVVGGTDVPVPAVPAGRRVVVVTCSEILACAGRPLAASLGFSHAEAFVVANAGARVTEPDGDVVRSAAAAFAACGGGEAFIVAHESCSFLASDPDAVAASLAAPNSSLLSALGQLCGASFVSARQLATASADVLRASPFLPRGTPVHALVLDARGRLSLERRGYDVVVAPAAPTAPLGLGASPSPILVAPGPTGFGAPGPVSLFGAAPIAPSPDLAAASAAFLSPPPPPAAPLVAAPPVVPPTAPSAPTWTSPPAPTPAPAATSPSPLKFDEPPPPPPRPAQKPSDPTDDPFRRAAETLERLRRARRK